MIDASARQSHWRRSIENMLVEIMRTELDRPLNLSANFAGPFPSGDTPIYIDTITRLGHSADFIGAVGPDDFGRCLLERFEHDGVDSSQVAILPDQTTSVAFIAYSLAAAVSSFTTGAMPLQVGLVRSMSSRIISIPPA